MKKPVFILLFFIAILGIVGWYFSNITFYFIFALVLAAILRPLTNRINSFHVIGQHTPRWLAILLSFGMVLTLIFLISLLFIPLISAQIKVISSYDLDYLYEQIQNPVGKVEDLLIKYEIVKMRQG